MSEQAAVRRDRNGEVLPGAEVLSPWKSPMPGQVTRFVTQSGWVTCHCPGGGEETHDHVITLEWQSHRTSIQTTSLKQYFRTFKRRRMAVEDMSHEILTALVAVMNPVWLRVEVARSIHDGGATTVTSSYTEPDHQG